MLREEAPTQDDRPRNRLEPPICTLSTNNIPRKEEVSMRRRPAPPRALRRPPPSCLSVLAPPRRSGLREIPVEQPFQRPKRGLECPEGVQVAEFLLGRRLVGLGGCLRKFIENWFLIS